MEVLVELRRCSNGYLCEVEVSNVIQVSFLWTRCAPERQLGLDGAKYPTLRSYPAPEYRQLWPSAKRCQTARCVALRAPRLRVCPEPASSSVSVWASPSLVLMKARMGCWAFFFSPLSVAPCFGW